MNNQVPAKLRWACRRGMLELDVILGKYLEEQYTTLSPDKKANFIELLHCTDPELFAWLLGTELPNDPRLASLIKEIQHYAKTSH